MRRKRDMEVTGIASIPKRTSSVTSPLQKLKLFSRRPILTLPTSIRISPTNASPQRIIAHTTEDLLQIPTPDSLLLSRHSFADAKGQACNLRGSASAPTNPAARPSTTTSSLKSIIQHNLHSTTDTHPTTITTSTSATRRKQPRLFHSPYSPTSQIPQSHNREIAIQ